MSREPLRERPGCVRAGGCPGPRRGPAFDHHALVHEDHLVGDLAGKGEFVGDHNHGHPGLGQGLHDVEHLADKFRVECRGRLVEEHELGLHGQCTGDGDPLLLAAGELLGVGMPPVAQPYPVQQCLGLGGDLAPRDGPRTRTGASTMFSNTVMCGNRLKRWKTIPACSRDRAVALLHFVQAAVAFGVADQVPRRRGGRR